MRSIADMLARHIRQFRTRTPTSGYIDSRRNNKLTTIEKCLASPTVDSFLEAALALEALGVIEGAAGVSGILGGDLSGWESLQASFVYSCWNVRICTGLFHKGRLKSGWSFDHLNLAARCLAHAMATNDDVFAEWCGTTLLKNFQSGIGLYDRSPRAFEPFMVHLFARWNRLSVPAFAIPCAPLGIYQDLFDTWDILTDFSKAVERVCDYHVEHSIDGVIAHAEFTRVPHNLFPADVLAIRRVRIALGSAWPEVEHPLLNTPFAVIPTPVTHIRGDIIERLSSAARLEFPNCT